MQNANMYSMQLLQQYDRLIGWIDGLIDSLHWLMVQLRMKMCDASPEFLLVLLGCPIAGLLLEFELKGPLSDRLVRRIVQELQVRMLQGFGCTDSLGWIECDILPSK